MTKVLYIGDLHARVSDLQECYRLAEEVVSLVKERNIEYVVHLGDALHTHLTVNLEALKFWHDFVDSVLKETSAQMVLVVGNHDKRVGADITDTHSMMSFNSYGDRVHVISGPKVLFPGSLFLPYYATAEDFIKEASGWDSNVLVCHQTFDGSTFENGMYAPDGIDADLLPQKQIISGHLHKGQEFGKVWYPGSPRWMTLADANEEKALWEVEHDVDGTILSKIPHDTSVYCTKIVSLIDNEGAPAELPVGDNLSVTVDIHGSPEYIAQRKVELQKSGVHRIRTFPTRDKQINVKESEGIVLAFNKYLDSFCESKNIDKTPLLNLSKERISWMRS